MLIPTVSKMKLVPKTKRARVTKVKLKATAVYLVAAKAKHHAKHKNHLLNRFGKVWKIPTKRRHDGSKKNGGSSSRNNHQPRPMQALATATTNKLLPNNSGMII